MADLTEYLKMIENWYKFLEEIEIKKSRFERQITEPIMESQEDYYNRTYTTVKLY